MNLSRWTDQEIFPVSGQSGIEEAINSATHAVGVLFGLFSTALLVSLVWPHGDRLFAAGVVIYGVTVVILYAVSTLYHSARSEKRKRFLQTVDHVAIYLVIAGTYTPFALGPLREGWGWGMLALIWGMAAIGMTLEAKHAVRNRAVSIALYLAMGWIALISFPTLLELLPMQALTWLLAGGTAYTIGTVFFLWNRLPFNHSIWHVFVLVGTVCHFYSILHFVSPMETRVDLAPLLDMVEQGETSSER